MRLVTLDARPGERTGVVVDDDVLDFAQAAAFVPLAGWVPPSMAALLAAREAGLDVIRRIVEDVRSRSADEREALRVAGALQAFERAPLLAPNPRPRVLLSHGRAYHSHRKEMRASYDPTVEEPPSAFLKNVNSIVGTRAPILVPPQCPSMIDLEAEFSIVFGADCHNVEESEALDYVAGYTLVNDVSARDWVINFRETGNPDLNRMGKQLPSFTPMGPVIATKDEIPDPHDVRLTSSINGQTMQDAHTSDLIWTIPALISYFSRWYLFRAGDVLTTGSPAGTGIARKPPLFLKPGDVVELSATGVGTLVNPVATAPASRQRSPAGSGRR